MPSRNKRKNNFVKQLKKYISIKGIELVVHLTNGETLELHNNVRLVKDTLIVKNKNNELSIPLSKIKSIDLYAA